MSYCHNCGVQIEAEDVYCTNCGTKQVQASSAKEEQSTTRTQTKPIISEVVRGSSNLTKGMSFTGLGDTLIKMLIKPVTGAKEFVEKGEKGSVIAITAIIIFIQGILGVWKVSQFISSLQNMAVDLMQKAMGFMNLIQPGSIGKLLSSNDIMELTAQIDKLKNFINIPYGKIFVQNSALAVTAIAVLFIIIYLGTNILSKHKSEPIQIFKTATVVLIPTLYFEILSIMFSYLSVYAGMVVGLIGIVISLATMAMVIKDKLSIDENHSTFITAVSGIVVLIIVVICLQKFTASNISDIIMSVSNVIKTIGF